MNPEGQPGQHGQPQSQQSSPNGVPPISGNPWQQPQQPPAQPGVQPQANPWGQPPQSQQPQDTPLPPVNQPFVPPSGNDGRSPEYSIDYLNQIAPKEQKVVNRFAVFGLIGAGLLTAIFALILLSSTRGPSVNDQIIPISERVATLQSVTNTEQTHLTEDQISEANAALSSSLVSMNTSLQTIMTARKLKVDSGSSSSKTEKSYAANLTTTLEDSYQRGTLDRTYTSQMTYELTVLRAKISKLKEDTANKDLLSFCNTSLNNIDIVLKAYASFDATKS